MAVARLGDSSVTPPEPPLESKPLNVTILFPCGCHCCHNSIAIHVMELCCMARGVQGPESCSRCSADEVLVTENSSEHPAHLSTGRAQAGGRQG